MKPDGHTLSRLDIDYFLKEFASEASNILPAVFAYGREAPLFFDSLISIYTIGGNINFKIPSMDKVYTLEALWGSFLAFSTISFDDFVFIFFAILLETPICFLSSNLCLLTSTMYLILYFSNIIYNIFKLVSLSMVFSNPLNGLIQ